MRLSAAGLHLALNHHHVAGAANSGNGRDQGALHPATEVGSINLDEAIFLIAGGHQLIAFFQGGTSLSGGVGSITGTVIGAAIIGVLNNGLVLLNVSPFWQQVVKGLVILLAVIIDKKSKKAP